MQGLLDSRESPKMEHREQRRENTPPSQHQHHHQQQQQQQHHQQQSGEMTRFQPDNSCCFCLTLRSGTAIIAVKDCVFYAATIIWYLSTSSLTLGGIRDGDALSSIDMSLFSLCVVMILVSILLLVAAIRQVPCQTLPWLCANTVAMVMSMILIVFTILFGTSTFKLNYSEYVTMLSLMGFHTGVTLFCWMVVFTFRKNLLMTAKYSLAPSQSAGAADSVDLASKSAPPSAPPPAYSEIDLAASWKPQSPSQPQDEPGPPGYDVVMSQQQQQQQQQQQPSSSQGQLQGAVKSLTNHNV